MADALCSTIPAITACSCQSGTKTAMVFSWIFSPLKITAGGVGRRRLNQAQRQTASKARLSRPLTRIIQASGNRQRATPTSHQVSATPRNIHPDKKAGITKEEVAEPGKVRSNCWKRYDIQLQSG